MRNPRLARAAYRVAFLLAALAVATNSPITAGLGDEPFRRGDANADRRVDLSDAIKTLLALFRSHSLVCPDAADSDDSGRLDVADPIYSLRYLFQLGAEPPAPGPTRCGPDATPDSLDCPQFPPCSMAGRPPELVALTTELTVVRGEAASISLEFRDPDQDISWLEVRQISMLRDETTRVGARALGIDGRESGVFSLDFATDDFPFGVMDFELRLSDLEELESEIVRVRLDVIGDSNPGTAPSILQLAFAESSLRRPSGLLDLVRVTLSLEFADPDDDIDSALVEVIRPGGASARTLGRTEALGIVGVSGSVTWPFLTLGAGDALGTYTASITLYDRAGRSSETSQASFELRDVGLFAFPRIVDVSPGAGLPGEVVTIRVADLDLDLPESWSLEQSDHELELLGIEEPSAGLADLAVLLPEGIESGPFVLRSAQGVAYSADSFVVPAFVRIRRHLPDEEGVAGATVAPRETLVLDALTSPRNAALVWSAGGVIGGSAELGVVSIGGVYAPPSTPPPSGRVRIRAALAEDAAVWDEIEVEVLAAVSIDGSALVTRTSGGTVSTRSGLARVEIPAGALARDTFVEVEEIRVSELPAPRAGRRYVGGAAFYPDGTQFSQNAMARLPLSLAFAPGTELDVITIDPESGAVLEEGRRGTVDESGEWIAVELAHFSTHVVETIAPSGLELLPPIRVDRVEPGAPLEEGRSVPVLLEGLGFTRDLELAVLAPGGGITPDIIPGTLHVLGDRAGVLLRIGTIPDLGGPGQAASRTYRLRLSRFGHLDVVEVPIEVHGLPELFVLEGTTRTLGGTVAGGTLHRYSEARIDGELVVADEGLEIEVTGPLSVTGRIDGAGAAGGSSTGRAHGVARLQGGRGGDGREDEGCFLGQNVFGTCEHDGAEDLNFGANAIECVGYPARGTCTRPSGGGRRVPQGMGGLPGYNVSLVEELVTLIVAAVGCAEGDLQSCVSLGQRAVSLFSDLIDIGEGRFTGRRGFGAVRGQGPSGGGGGGGGGRMTAVIPSVPLAGDILFRILGGGGGAGGDGGRTFRATVGGWVSLEETLADGSVRRGSIDCAGGDGGDGARTSTLEISVSALALLGGEIRSFDGIPCLPGGGGGGGSGGRVSVRSGGEFPDLGSTRITARGGRGGSGGVTVVDARSGNWRTDYRYDAGSDGPFGSATRLGPLFDTSTLDHAVVTRRLLRTRDRSFQPRTVRVVADDGRETLVELDGSGHSLVPLFDGFNTVETYAHELLEKRILVLAEDSDSDGLSDSDELEFGTDPASPDTDEDGLGDLEEILLGLSPTIADGDFDGLPDGEELRFGTDPANRDTDGDFASDGIEALLGSDALDTLSRAVAVPQSFAVVRIGARIGVVDPDSGRVGLGGSLEDALGFGLATGPDGQIFAASGDELLSVTPLLTTLEGQAVSIALGLFDPSAGAIECAQITAHPQTGELRGVELGPAPSFAPTGQLLAIDPVSGLAARLGAPLARPIHALAFLHDGRLVATLGGAATDELVEIDPASGSSIASIGDTAHANLFGLTVFGPNRLIASAFESNTETRLLELDPGDATPTDLSTARGALFSLTSLPCPEPCFLPEAVQHEFDYAHVSMFRTADLDGDGDLDLAAPVVAAVEILLGDGSGRFERALGSPYALGPEIGDSRVVTLELGDVDGDGVPEIVAAISYRREIAVLSYDGTGGFEASASVPMPSIDSRLALLQLCLGDVNGDGHLDVVGTNQIAQTPSELTVLLGDGAGGFSSGGLTPFGTEIAPRELVIADVNGDAHPDVLVLMLYVASRPDSLRIFAGDGTGGFAAPTSHDIGRTSGLIVEDFDGDNAPELLTNRDGELSLFDWDPGGAPIVPPRVLPLEGSGLGPRPEAQRLADVDGDGLEDFLDTIARGVGYWPARRDASGHLAGLAPLRPYLIPVGGQLGMLPGDADPAGGLRYLIVQINIGGGRSGLAIQRRAR